MSLNIVVFCAVEPGSDRTLPGNLTGAQQTDLLFRSALLRHPDVKLTVLSSPETDLRAISSPFTRVNRAVDFSRLMNERTQMQREFLAGYDFEQPLAFLDSDMLVTGEIASVFASDFDVGLTWRKSDEMPFNGGAIYVNNRRPENVRRFFDRIDQIYREKFEGTAVWYGDQFALSNFVDLPFADLENHPSVTREGVEIALLPCDRYNFSPNGERPDLSHLKPDALLYHFKGMSRRTMQHYWELHLSPQAASGPLRSVRIMVLNTVLRLQRGAYKRRLKGDNRKFNCEDQNEAAWVDRAEIAASLIQHAAGGQATITVADIGCGDGKLGRILSGQACYSGFDLIPQSPQVVRFDIERDVLPRPYDAVAILGVLEYSADPVDALTRVRPLTKHLVVSHAVSDLRNISASRKRKLNWRSHLSKNEFEKCIASAGFAIAAEKTTANGRSLVWLCR